MFWQSDDLVQVRDGGKAGAALWGFVRHGALFFNHAGQHSLRFHSPEPLDGPFACAALGSASSSLFMGGDLAILKAMAMISFRDETLH
jgi:hypothetical protein